MNIGWLCYVCKCYAHKFMSIFFIFNLKIRFYTYNIFSYKPCGRITAVSRVGPTREGLPALITS